MRDFRAVRRLAPFIGLVGCIWGVPAAAERSEGVTIFLVQPGVLDAETLKHLMNDERDVRRYVVVLTTGSAGTEDDSSDRLATGTPEWVLMKPTQIEDRWDTRIAEAAESLGRKPGDAATRDPLSIRSTRRLARAIKTALYDHWDIVPREQRSDGLRLPIDIVMLLSRGLRERLGDPLSDPICQDDSKRIQSDALQQAEQAHNLINDILKSYEKKVSTEISVYLGAVNHGIYTWKIGDVYNLLFGFGLDRLSANISSIAQINPSCLGQMRANDSSRFGPQRSIDLGSYASLLACDALPGNEPLREAVSCASGQTAPTDPGDLNLPSPSITNRRASAPIPQAYPAPPASDPDPVVLPGGGPPISNPPAPLPDPIPPPALNPPAPVYAPASRLLPARLTFVARTAKAPDAPTDTLWVDVSVTDMVGAAASIVRLPPGAAEPIDAAARAGARQKLQIRANVWIRPVGRHRLLLLIEPTEDCLRRNGYSVEVSIAGSRIDPGTSGTLTIREIDGQCQERVIDLSGFPGN